MLQEKEDLISKSQEYEHRIDLLVKDHMKEIEELKRELALLKEEMVEGEESAEGEEAGEQEDTQFCMTERENAELPLK
jgi:uncharacterized Ntn-hydrolase superfamily protein